MKSILSRLCSAIFFLLIANIPIGVAQWSIQGPYGGADYTLIEAGGKAFVGTRNGLFSSSDNGKSWNASNNGLENKIIIRLVTQGSTIIAGSTEHGVYFSSDNGMSWTAKNKGLSNLYITSLLSGPGLFAGTYDGVFFSSDNGNSWTLANTGIPPTYVIYSFAHLGDTVYAGTYGKGLYRTTNKGNNWTPVGGGFPGSSFVYALIVNGNTLLAGTSSGIYKSINRGLTWMLSNKGFPSSVWAKSFTSGSDYIFAGTYAEGIFLSLDNGDSWAPKNTGLPDLPFSSGMPHNYPSIEAIITVGPNILAATVNGLYISYTKGNSWLESNPGILATDVLAITTNGSHVFAGTDRTGMYVSPDHGNSWYRSNKGLNSYDILALAVHGTSVFASARNQKVFRSDDNGNTWFSASAGLGSDAGVLKSDNLRVLAVTTGARYVPPGLFQTLDKGASWAEIPTGFSGRISTAVNHNNELYAGTWSGNIFYSNTGGNSWQDKSYGLPPVKINTILAMGSSLFAGTDGGGIYTTSNNGSTWTAINNGIGNLFITDIHQQSSVLYAATWGGGIYLSDNLGDSWSIYNDALTNLSVKQLCGEGSMLYAATGIGVYVNSAATGIGDETEEEEMSLYPNPSSGIIYIKAPASKKILLTVTNVAGEMVYWYEGYPDTLQSIDLSGRTPGVYFVRMESGKKSVQGKIIIQ